MYLPGIVSNAALPKVISPSSPNRKEIKARRAPKEGRKEGRNREAAGKTERGDANAGGVSMRTKRKGRGRDTRRIAATFASVTLPYFWASRYSQDAQAHLLERLLRWEVSRTWAKEQNRRTILYEVGTRQIPYILLHWAWAEGTDEEDREGFFLPSLVTSQEDEIFV